MRHQNEDGAGRRLLQALERIGSVLVHFLGWMHEGDSEIAAV